MRRKAVWLIVTLLSVVALALGAFGMIPVSKAEASPTWANEHEITCDTVWGKLKNNNVPHNYSWYVKKLGSSSNLASGSGTVGANQWVETTPYDPPAGFSGTIRLHIQILYWNGFYWAVAAEAYWDQALNCPNPTPTNTPVPDYKLNLSHIECVDGQVEIHFVLLDVPDGVTPGTLTFTYGTIEPGAHTGNTWHYTWWGPDGFYNVTSASVVVGGVTVSLHNPGDYAGNYDCAPNPPAEAGVQVGTCEYDPNTGNALTPVTVTLVNATITVDGQVVTESGTFYLAPGEYDWVATANEGYEFDGPAPSGHISAVDCTPAPPAVASVVAGLCFVDDAGLAWTRVTVTLEHARVNIGGTWVETSGEVLVAPGSYNWYAEALPGYEFDGPAPSGQINAIDCRPTATPIPPTETPVVPPTETPVVPPTETPVVPPTETPVVPPTETPVVPPTETPVVPPTETPVVPPTELPPPGSKPAHFSMQVTCIGETPYLLLGMSEGVYVYVKDEAGAVVAETGTNSGIPLVPGKTYVVHPTYAEGYWMVDDAGRVDTTFVAPTDCSPAEVPPTQAVVGGGGGGLGDDFPFGPVMLAVVLIAAVGVWIYRRRIRR